MSPSTPPMPAWANLSPVQAKVVIALAAGSSLTDAALQAGVHRATVHEWLRKQRAFSTALQQARREYEEFLDSQLRSLSAKALGRLAGLLDDPQTPPAVALRAALAVLERPHYPVEGWGLPQPARLPSPSELRLERAAPQPAHDTIRQITTEIPLLAL